MDRIDLALLLARRATLLEAHSAYPDAPVADHPARAQEALARAVGALGRRRHPRDAGGRTASPR